MLAEPVGGLVAQDITVRYGGVVANDRVSLEIPPGSIVGLIGPNGAGKTTLIDALTGFTPASGTVTIGGGRVDGMSPNRRRRSGLARTWQAGELFDGLSVLANLETVASGSGWRPLWRDLQPWRRRTNPEAMAVLQELGLADVAGRDSRELSLGRQRLVGVGRALMGAPDVVLLDEPAAGLDSHESRLLGQKLAVVAERGVAILLIDHDMDLVFDVSERVYVIDFGQVIASGTPAEVRRDTGVLRAYLGSAAS